MFKKINQVDDYHGTKVYDPYRWLEDIHSKETEEFIDEHNKITKEFIESYEGYEDIKRRMEQLSKEEKYSVPSKKGDYYYFFYNDGVQNQACFCRAKDFMGEKEILIDPNNYSEDSTSAIMSIGINSERDILAYSISEKGSDWQEIRLLDMKSKNHLEDRIKWCRFTGISWLADNESFIYSRYPEMGTMDDEELSYHSMVCIHKIGTPQENDILLVDGKEKSSYSNYAGITEDKKYIFMSKVLGTSPNNKVFFKKYEDDKFIELFENKTASWNFIGNEGEKFYCLTNYKAPKNRILELDINDLHNEESWKEIISEDKSNTISFAIYSDGYIVMAVMEDGHHKLMSYDLKLGALKEYELPTIGSISDIGKGYKEIFFAFESYFLPETMYRLSLETGEVEKLTSPDIDFNFDDYESKLEFVTSKDGTRVPMVINYKKGLVLDGHNPTLLHAYGGFNLAKTPQFRIPELVWMERGGVFAVANIRGGDEYGEEWHEAAILENKQNCFDDFIACGEWLIDKKYTSKKKLAIRGRSNGGLLTGACMVQRPDLYGAVISQVGVLDMLRYHKYTIGRFWIPEYGDAENNEEHFKFLFKYSPLHNIRCGVVYPPVLVATGDSDDRVLPCHSYKFVATLEEISCGENPILLNVDKNTGHGQGKPVEKLINEEAYIYSFLEKILLK